MILIMFVGNHKHELAGIDELFDPQEDPYHPSYSKSRTHRGEEIISNVRLRYCPDSSTRLSVCIPDEGEKFILWTDFVDPIY